MTEVILKCVLEHRKLRVKIITPGYFNNANCQFPTAIRQEGMYYTCLSSDITISNTRNMYFYRIRKAGINIIIKNHDEIAVPFIKPEKVFTDLDEHQCNICMSEPKSIIFTPCGHFCSCKTCSSKLNNKCHVCRAIIIYMITPEQMT